MTQGKSLCLLAGQERKIQDRKPKKKKIKSTEERKQQPKKTPICYHINSNPTGSQSGMS